MRTPPTYSRTSDSLREMAGNQVPGSLKHRSLNEAVVTLLCFRVVCWSAFLVSRHGCICAHCVNAERFIFCIYDFSRLSYCASRQRRYHFLILQMDLATLLCPDEACIAPVMATVVPPLMCEPLTPSSMHSYPQLESTTITFACAVCSRVFAHRGSLNRHCSKYHGLRPPPQRRRSKTLKQLQKPYKCSLCTDMRYKTREGLRVHLLRWHMQPRSDSQDSDYA